jgi:hypothetical protein
MQCCAKKGTLIREKTPRNNKLQIKWLEWLPLTVWKSKYCRTPPSNIPINKLRAKKTTRKFSAIDRCTEVR